MMSSLSRRCLWASLFGLAVSPAIADDVSGSRHLLCATLEAQVCVEGVGCEEFWPDAIAVPRFVRVDTKDGVLATTPASGEDRVSKASTVLREQGHIVLQGFEDGRAFSLYISESTGLATMASAAAGRILNVFSACTPEVAS